MIIATWYNQINQTQPVPTKPDLTQLSDPQSQLDQI